MTNVLLSFNKNPGKSFKRLCFVLAFSLIALFALGNVRDTLDLSGLWNYRLKGAPSSIPGEGQITLPNTLDNARKSIYNPPSDNTAQLRREFSFIGEASYSKKISIPQSWQGKIISLILERTKPAIIKIDGDTVAYSSLISAPQHFDLTEYLSPGKHSLEIIVNNKDSIPPIVARSSNAVSESSQTNWNGILGNIILEAKNPENIASVEIKDKNAAPSVDILVSLSNPARDNLKLVVSKNGHISVASSIRKGVKDVEIKIPIDSEELWSAQNPNLITLTFDLKNNRGIELDKYSIITGFRDFSVNGTNIIINGNPIFLRGTINASVFPLTAHPPLDNQYWINYFSTLKDYGINHVRFHSWTPPEAAFQAADSLGIYLLVELPIWGELDRDLKFHNRFLKKELKGIMETYSFHPSFVMFSPGNELWGDISLMGEYMNEAKTLNPRILATYGSNLYLGMKGEIGGEDFIVTARTDDDVKNSVRGSVSFADSSTGGYFNSTYPNSSENFAEALSNINVPVISHEVGQYQIYPDFSEIEDYTGVLKPDNLKEFRKHASAGGTLNKAALYREASGKWASKLYKAEMEMALRTPGIAGVELFGLQDFTGQGTALVGILNPFMKSKGYIEPAEWKESCSDIVLMAEFPKFIYTEGETVEIPILTANFSNNPDTIGAISWNAEFASGFLQSTPGEGIIENGSVFMKIPKIDSPQKIKFSLSSSTGNINNEYNIWIYPKNIPEVKGISVTTNVQEALKKLQKGNNVILLPDSATITSASLGPLFTPDFWNYRMFRTICEEMNMPVSPGTLGLLVNSQHPSLKYFPTDNHTDWQWFSIVTNSRPLIIDRLPKDFDPIVEVIDNVERNFRLALMLECKVGKGNLMIIPADLEKLIQYPEGKWFLQSVKEYMASKECEPSITLTPDQVLNLLTKPSTTRKIKELKNETYNSSWRD